MKLTRLFTAALVAVAACQKAETPEQAAARMEQESAAARTAIEAQGAAFAAHFSAGHADSVAAYYTENGEILPPNSPAASGRANIASWMAAGLAMGSYTLNLTTQGVMASGDNALERGAYVFTYAPGPNAPKGSKAMADTGKYIAHWHREGGTWLMAHDIWNSDIPLPQP